MTRIARVPLLCALSAAMLGVALAAPVAAFGGETTPAAPDCRWRVVTSPPDGDGDSILAAVDAVAADDVWAVGLHGRVTQEKTLIEHFDGAAWAVVPSPNPRRTDTDGNELFAVDARSATDVWAVGFHSNNGHLTIEPLILHSDGSHWRVIPNPPGDLIGGFLRGVAAVSADDVWAVGARPAGPGELNPLVLHWDGSVWNIVDVPNPPGMEGDFLTSVSAASADDVWAVGQQLENTSLTMHFDGNSWRIVPSPSIPQALLTGVVARASDDAWAVGSDAANGSLSFHWDGRLWNDVPTGHRPVFDGLNAVASDPTGNLWAVGIDQTPSGSYRPFAQRFDGTTWQVSRTASPGGGDRFLGVTTTSGGVWAVGATADNPGTEGHALIEHHC